LKVWRKEFQNAAKGQIGFWEGNIVFKDLRVSDEPTERGLLFLTLSSRITDWRDKDAISTISAEVIKYKETVGKVVSVRKEFEESAVLLSEIMNMLQACENRVSIEELKTVLRELRAHIDPAVISIRRLENNRWNTPGVWGNVMRHRKQGSRRAGPLQETDLDSYFQLRIARILRVLVPKEDLSRVSVARLVVLTYMSTGLAEERNGHLMTLVQLHRQAEELGDKKRSGLTVQQVEENLRRGGMK